MDDNMKKSFKVAAYTTAVYGLIGLQKFLYGLDGALVELVRALQAEGLKNVDPKLLEKYKDYLTGLGLGDSGPKGGFN